MKALKDYVYISDTKVDTLFGGIKDSVLKKVTASLEIDFKFVKATFSGDVDLDRAKHRVQRLETVIAYLEKANPFGTVDHPDEYVRESNLNMTWGEIKPALFFAGWTDKTLIGLGGSPKHLIGNTGAATTTASYTFALLDCLRPIVAEDERKAIKTSGVSDDDSLAVIESAIRNFKGPREPMEFVAKRLLYGPSLRSKPLIGADEPQRKVLLATPLYVARL